MIYSIKKFVFYSSLTFVFIITNCSDKTISGIDTPTTLGTGQTIATGTGNVTGTDGGLIADYNQNNGGTTDGGTGGTGGGGHKESRLKRGLEYTGIVVGAGLLGYTAYRAREPIGKTVTGTAAVGVGVLDCGWNLLAKIWRSKDDEKKCSDAFWDRYHGIQDGIWGKKSKKEKEKDLEDIKNYITAQIAKTQNLITESTSFVLPDISRFKVDEPKEPEKKITTNETYTEILDFNSCKNTPTPSGIDKKTTILIAPPGYGRDNGIKFYSFNNDVGRFESAMEIDRERDEPTMTLKEYIGFYIGQRIDDYEKVESGIIKTAYVLDPEDPSCTWESFDGDAAVNFLKDQIKTIVGFYIEDSFEKINETDINNLILSFILPSEIEKEIRPYRSKYDVLLAQIASVQAENKIILAESTKITDEAIIDLLTTLQTKTTELETKTNELQTKWEEENIDNLLCKLDKTRLKREITTLEILKELTEDQASLNKKIKEKENKIAELIKNGCE
jgi:hypothetical protein